MPSDPGQTSYLGYLFAVLFGGGGAAKLVTHEGRIKSLEVTMKSKSEDIKEIALDVRELNTKANRADEDRQDMKAALARIEGKLP